MDRINMSMTFYGGVSLAVFEAGVAEEFLRFVQFCREKNKDVNIRVISGTSAGGLAAVLMSAALVNSDDPTEHIKHMRRIWFDVADLSMIQYERGQKVRSLLNNDVLEKEVIKFLNIKNAAKKAPGKSSSGIKILITGTNMQGFFDVIPVEYSFTDKDEFARRIFSTTRHTEVFIFDDNHIRSSDPELQKRIAKAARITSTFPAAFPPQYVLSPSFPEEVLDWYKERKSLAKPLHFWYFDGGVLDNKPLGHAIDHMQSNRAEGDWWYFFVEPKPQQYEKKHEEWGTSPDNPPDPAQALMAVLEARGVETIFHDLRRIQKINHQVMQTKSLVNDLWGILSGYSGSSQKLIDAVPDNIRTARIHRFLPDYVKCATLIRFYKLPEDRISVEDVQKGQEHSMSTLRPLDLLRIFDDGIKNEMITKNLSGDTVAMLDKDEVLRAALEKFDGDASEVRKAQLLFRQITFWIEYDFKKGQEENIQTEEDKRNLEKRRAHTLQSFREAEKKLTEALDALDGAYRKFEHRLMEIVNDEESLLNIKAFILLNEAIHAAAGLETREKINVVKIHNDTVKYGQLAGAQIANFAGFLDRRWRKNDYLIGMKNAREMLSGRLSEDIPDTGFWTEYKDWREKSEDVMPQAYALTDRDVLNEADKDLVRLPADKIIGDVTGIISSTEKIIKHSGSIFFRVSRFVKVHWLLPVVRFILWLLRHATTNRLTGKERTESFNLALFKKNSTQYLTFMVIGIILGLIIAFFLPSIFRDVAEWIWRLFK